jgi:hypothetical protein
MPQHIPRTGDITVNVIREGFLVGRILEHIGAGPWWQYIATAKTLDIALAIARQFAAAAKVRAWFRPTERGDYTEIVIRPTDDSV